MDSDQLVGTRMSREDLSELVSVREVNRVGRFCLFVGVIVGVYFGVVGALTLR